MVVDAVAVVAAVGRGSELDRRTDSVVAGVVADAVVVAHWQFLAHGSWSTSRLVSEAVAVLRILWQRVHQLILLSEKFVLYY